MGLLEVAAAIIRFSSLLTLITGFSSLFFKQSWVCSSYNLDDVKSPSDQSFFTVSAADITGMGTSTEVPNIALTSICVCVIKAPLIILVIFLCGWPSTVQQPPRQQGHTILCD